MSIHLGALKESHEALEPHETSRLRSVPPREGKKTARGAWWLRLILFAMVLAGFLVIWRFGPWLFTRGTPQGSESASSLKTSDAVEEVGPPASLAASGDVGNRAKGNGVENQEAQGSGNQRTAPPVKPGLASKNPEGGSRSAAVKGNSTGYPSGEGDGSPSVGKSGPSPQAYSSPAMEGNGDAVPVNPRMRRSAARRDALIELSGRLPSAYFDQNRNAGTPAAVRASDSPAWQEPAPAGNSSDPAGKGTDGSRWAANGRAASEKGKGTGELVAWQDLPMQIREALPLSISMLVYSKKAEERLIVVDDHYPMGEGQEVAGLKVEEIGPDGAIFTYRGYRFRKAANGD